MAPGFTGVGKEILVFGVPGGVGAGKAKETLNSAMDAGIECKFGVSYAGRASTNSRAVGAAGDSGGSVSEKGSILCKPSSQVGGCDGSGRSLVGVQMGHQSICDKVMSALGSIGGTTKGICLGSVSEEGVGLGVGAKNTNCVGAGSGAGQGSGLSKV